MSYFDLMSSDSYGSFNRRLANLTSLEVAVYWAEILDIVLHVVKKNKFDADGSFTLDREYIKQRTTIGIEDQMNYDEILASLSVLNRAPEDCNKIAVNLQRMAEIITSDEIKKLAVPRGKLKVSKATAAKNKRDAVISGIKKCIVEEDNNLHILYESWVDSVYGAGRFLTKAKVNNFITAINNYSNDITVKTELINIGIQTGYDNVEWVINKYNTVHHIVGTATIIGAPQQVATELSGESF